MFFKKLQKWFKKLHPRKKRVVGQRMQLISFGIFMDYLYGRKTLDDYRKNKIGYTTQDIYEDGTLGPEIEH
jgi:hypothetical protein